MAGDGPSDRLLALADQGVHVGQDLEGAAGGLEDLRVGSAATELELLLDELGGQRSADAQEPAHVVQLRERQVVVDVPMKKPLADLASDAVEEELRRPRGVALSAW